MKRMFAYVSTIAVLTVMVVTTVAQPPIPNNPPPQPVPRPGFGGPGGPGNADREMQLSRSEIMNGVRPFPPNSEADKLRMNERNLEGQTQRLIHDFTNTKDEAARGKLSAEIRQTVEQQFAARQELRTLEISELEAQIKNLKDIHEQRNSQKERIVKDRVDQLLRDASGLGWGANGPGSGGGGNFRGNFFSSDTRSDNFGGPQSTSRRSGADSNGESIRIETRTISPPR